MKKLYFIISTFIVIFAFSNITSIDISNELYPTSLAIDYNQNSKQYTLHLQVVNPTFLSKNENMRPNSINSTFSIKQTGHSIYDCYNKLNSISKKRISLRHIQSLLISNNFIENSPQVLITNLKLLIKNPTLPANIYIYATSNKIEDVYNNQNILDESSYYSILNNPQDSNIASIVYPQTLLQICQSILDHQKSFYIPSIFLDDSIESTDKEGEIQTNKVFNIDGCYFTTINDYSFSFLTHKEIEGFQYLYSKKIDTLEIHDINDIYYLRIHEIKSTLIAKEEENKFVLKLNNIDLICPYDSDIKLIENNIQQILSDKLNILYHSALEKNIDIFNILDFRYRYKKSPNNIDLTIVIKTNFQTIKYYSSTTT